MLAGARRGRIQPFQGKFACEHQRPCIVVQAVAVSAVRHLGAAMLQHAATIRHAIDRIERRL
jgi:hypothetical protein